MMKMFYIIKPVHKYPNILNPQIVLCGFKNFHVHMSGIQIEFSRLYVSRFTLSSSAGCTLEIEVQEVKKP